jgi:hypothetical protein
MVDHVSGVPACGEQRVGQNRVLELEPYEVQPGHDLDHAPLVGDVTVIVEDR